jgi:hypothetical protein
MEKAVTRNLGKSPEEDSLSVQAEAKHLMWAAFPPRIEDNRKSYFHRVARELNWKVRRVRAFFHCEARVTVEELRQLEARYEIQQQRAEQRRKDHDELKTLLHRARIDVPVGEREAERCALADAGDRSMGDQEGRSPSIDE